MDIRLKYKVTGVDRNGRRFKAIFTHNKMYALGINLWKGSVWEHDGEKYRRVREVWN